MTRDADLRALVSYDIKRANAAIMGDVERVLSRHGLRRTTFSALSVIGTNAPIRQSDVAEVLSIERPNLVQILDELKRSGLITRARDASDRRVYLLSVTGEGEALLDRAGRDLSAYDARLMEGLNAEQRAALIEGLALVESNRQTAWEGWDAGSIHTP